EDAMKLYELPIAFEHFADKLADQEGELTGELEIALGTLENELARLVDAICALVQRFTRQAEAAKAEADRLLNLPRVRANAAMRLKDYLKQHLECLRIRKYETNLFRVRVQANSRPSILWRDGAEAIPPAFRRLTIALDGDAAYEAWKANELP